MSDISSLQENPTSTQNQNIQPKGEDTEADILENSEDKNSENDGSKDIIIVENSDQPVNSEEEKNEISKVNKKSQPAGNATNNNSKPSGDPTGDIFTTTNDKLDIRVPEKPERLPPLTKTNPQKSSRSITAAEKVPDKKRHADLSFLNKVPVQKKPIEPMVHIKHHNNAFSPDEIVRAADNYLKTGKVQLSDPIYVAEIIEELTSRYIEYLGQNEYLAAQDVRTKIDFLRTQFRQQDAILFVQNHLKMLETRKKSLESQVKSIRSTWKQKYHEFDEFCKNEIYNLQEKQQSTWTQMEREWSDPSKQRKYSKQSKTLLINRTIERYMVLAGDLEAAEQMKRKNKRAEKSETIESFNEMSNDFENARNKLTSYFEKQEEDLVDEQKIKKTKLKNDEFDEVQQMKKRITVLEKMIIEEKLPSFQEKKIIHSRISNSSDLPMLQRTAKNITAKNQVLHQTAQVSVKPLPLPPLKMNPRPKKRAKSQMTSAPSTF